jgi:hypothetical protein
MGPLQELLAVDERQALEFFVVGLTDICETAVDRQELVYNASVLAHYAQVSTQAGKDLPTPSTLCAVFDQFVLGCTMTDDGPLLETAGAQCLLMAGFFEDQLRRRHNIRWYAQLGAGFFARAAACTSSARKAHLLDGLSRRFEPWRRRHARLGRELRDCAYLVAPPEPPSAA